MILINFFIVMCSMLQFRYIICFIFILGPEKVGKFLIQFSIIIDYNEIEEIMSNSSCYKFKQVLGYLGPTAKINQKDNITSIKFDQSGQYLALGDKAGLVTIFQTKNKNRQNQTYYDHYAQFQSHNNQFDYLNSYQVSQNITDICWLNKQNKYQKIISTNSKFIKIWKIFQKTDKKVTKSCGKSIKNMPELEDVDKSLIAHLQEAFPSKHQTDIHTISKSTNQQYLLSFDQIQGFMWHLERPDKPYLIIDYLKGLEPQNVKQNISCGKYHPTSDSILAYGTNKKTLKLHDMRISAQQNDKTTRFKYESKGAKNFFTDYIQSYSSVQFLKNGRYVAARNLLTVKVWDLANTKKPILDVYINQIFKNKLVELFEKDCLSDKFNLTCSSDGNTLLTGSYNNYFHLIDVDSSKNNQYELDYTKQTIKREILSGKPMALPKLNYEAKTCVSDFNKTNNTIAVSSQNCFFIYSMDEK